MPEIYTGVKFKTEFISKTPPQNEKILDAIYWANLISEKGMAPYNNAGSAGNLSFRLENSNRFIITATASDLGLLINSHYFVEVCDCNLRQKIVKAKGKHQPSSESMMHYFIYNKRKDVNAIIHGHWPEKLSLLQNGNYTCTNNEAPYGTILLIEELNHVIANHNFIVLKNHGFLAMGKSLKEAGELIDSIYDDLLL